MSKYIASRVVFLQFVMFVLNIWNYLQNVRTKNCDARLTTLFYLHKIMKIIDITNNIPNTISIHGQIYLTYCTNWCCQLFHIWQNYNNSINNSSANIS